MEMDEYQWEWEYIKYNRFFYNTLCHVCKTDRNIKRCSACKLVSYCSRQHQMRDRKLHKKLCKVIADTDNSLSRSSFEKFQNFKDYKVVLSVLWKNKLGRPLDPFEEQMWMFPRVCAICFSKDALIDCQGCLNVSYCSEEHKNKFWEVHLKYCNALRLCMDIDLHNFNEGYRATEINVKQFDDSIIILPNNLEELMVMYDDSISVNTLTEKINFIIKANYVGPVATILYGLEKSGLLSNRNFSKNTLTVHIVGADNITEMGWLWKIITELPFHWIQNVDELNFFVIGPELCHDGITDNKFEKQFCGHCKEKNVNTCITFCWKLYHDVVDSLSEPDIVVALNSGLHEFYNSKNNTWKESIRDLTKFPGVPLILTAYTLDEIKQDVDIVRGNSKGEVNIILGPTRNPFSNMTPFRDWENIDIPIFYINGYIAILSA